VTGPLLEVISRHWGYSTLRPLQQEAMAAALSGRDSLVVLPTGGGKSLCYQAPALLKNDLTVVVSPLISLMKDQVDALVACGVAAAQMNSSQSSLEQRATEKDALDGRIKLLFISPERLMMPSCLSMLRAACATTFAIDEAHCISHWGHDFRPEYRQLSALRDLFPGASIHAYTATATEMVRRDIVAQLALHDPLMLVGDFDRPNLTYRVLPRREALKQVIGVLNGHGGEAGIIYCLRRSDVDTLSSALQLRGYSALPYHAGLPAEARRSAQEAFAAERCDVVVATVAFGMGIDRPNVRFVLHTAMPKSIEHYQQETGRAGRDGLEAECVLLYSGSDAIVWKSMTEREEERRQTAEIDRYCWGTTCRHRALLHYFGQQYSSDTCAACDVCLGETEDVPEATLIAQKILSCVYRLRQAFGIGHVVSVLRGDQNERIRTRNHDRLSTYGLLKDHARNEIRDWTYQLVAQGFLIQTRDEYPVLRLGPSSREVLRGEVTIRLRQPAVAKKPDRRRARASTAGAGEGTVNGQLFEALRSWRRRVAEARHVPPYVIFGDRTLRELAASCPTTLVELRSIYGIGDAKLSAYGRALLEQIGPFAAS
jgi:ATP-dependent DNA helicase RecQ